MSVTVQKLEALKFNTKNETIYPICLTPGCIHSANDILKRIDTSIDPCDDFYNFACGKFIAETFLPEDEISVDIFSLVDNKLNERLLKIVSEDVNESEAKPFQLAKKLFKACMNQCKRTNSLFETPN